MSSHPRPPYPFHTVTAKTNKQARTGLAKMIMELDSKEPSVLAVNKWKINQLENETA